MIYPLD